MFFAYLAHFVQFEIMMMTMSKVEAFILAFPRATD